MKTYLMTFSDLVCPDPRYGRGESHWVTLAFEDVENLQFLADELERHRMLDAFQLTEGVPPGAPIGDFAAAARAFAEMAASGLDGPSDLSEEDWRDLAEVFASYTDVLSKKVAEEFGDTDPDRPSLPVKDCKP